MCERDAAFAGFVTQGASCVGNRVWGAVTIGPSGQPVNDRRSFLLRPRRGPGTERDVIVKRAGVNRDVISWLRGWEVVAGANIEQV